MGCMRKYDMLLYDNGNKGIYITKALLYKTPQRLLQNASVIQVASIIPNTTALGLQTRGFDSIYGGQDYCLQCLQYLLMC